MSFYRELYSHNTHRQFMIIKEKYNANEDVDTYQSLYHKVMSMQMNTKKGIELFGERAIIDMFKEYKQLDDGTMPVKPVVAPYNPDVITSLDRKKTLEAVNLIKEKRCGKINESTCANCSKQIKYIKVDDNVYSPTCSTKALMETLVIDAMDQRDVAIFDVPGTFLQTVLPVDKFFLMRIRYEFVDVMCEVKPEYIPCVRYGNGK